MKTIGLIGGMSWESTAVYYKLFNEGIKARLGGFHSAKCLVHSVDFAEIVECQHRGDWVRAAEILGDAAKGLEQSGADFLLIGTNTLHKVADEVQAAVSIPLVHIADATAEAIEAQGLRRVGLLGTAYTMEQPFLIERFAARGIEVVVPEQEERAMVHEVIFEELVKGDVREVSREKYLRLVERLVARGAQGVILGCTEIPLLLKQEDAPVPLFDTTRLHAEKAVELALV